MISMTSFSVVEPFEQRTLDALIGLPPDRANPRGLLARWDELTPERLPPMVWSVLRDPRVGVRQVLEALVDEDIVRSAARVLPVELSSDLAVLHGSPRQAQVTVRRLGLEDADVPTLENLSKAMGVTRERIRQIQIEKAVVITQRSVADGWAAQSLRAWFDLHPQLPLLRSHLVALTGSPMELQALELVADAVATPAELPVSMWTIDEKLARAAHHVFDARDILLGSRGIGEGLDRLRAELPGIESRIELAPFVQALLLDGTWDVGPALDGRLIDGISAYERRVARKILTYLAARSCPIGVEDLADVIASGQYPFEVFERPPLSAERLVALVESTPDLLQLLVDGDVWFADAVTEREPAPRVALVRDIVRRNQGPMSMQALVEAAAERGVGRNQVQVLIHSRRATCLFILKRGIVGLVGRDEDADASEFTATSPWAFRRNVRPGRGIGIDAAGALETHLVARRSLHEQGFGLPWPFSLAVLDLERTELVVNGRQRRVRRVGETGDLRIDDVDPGASVYVTMRAGPQKRRLTIDTSALRPVREILADGAGTSSLARRGGSTDVPIWLQAVHGCSGTSPADLLALLPDVLDARRRQYAIHGLVALGVVVVRDTQWTIDASRPIPRAILEVFRRLRVAPHDYHHLDDDERTIAAWLVRASWLNAQRGWGVVHEAGVEPPEAHENAVAQHDEEDTLHARLAEAIELLLDGVADGPDEREVHERFARRCLQALGWTWLGAIRPSGTGDLLGVRGDEVVVRWSMLAGSDVKSPVQVSSSGTTVTVASEGSVRRLQLSEPGNAGALRDLLQPVGAP